MFSLKECVLQKAMVFPNNLIIAHFLPMPLNYLTSSLAAPNLTTGTEHQAQDAVTFLPVITLGCFSLAADSR